MITEQQKVKVIFQAQVMLEISLATEIIEF
jgi:hypothetical protein